MFREGFELTLVNDLACLGHIRKVVSFCTVPLQIQESWTQVVIWVVTQGYGVCADLFQSRMRNSLFGPSEQIREPGKNFGSGVTKSIADSRKPNSVEFDKRMHNTGTWDCVMLRRRDFNNQVTSI